jgi:hypothetical protein
MNRISTLAIIFLLAAGGASAKDQCRDARGAIVRCKPAPAFVSRCRDRKTKQPARCGRPNAEPVPAGKR